MYDNSKEPLCLNGYEDTKTNNSYYSENVTKMREVEEWFNSVDGMCYGDDSYFSCEACETFIEEDGYKYCDIVAKSVSANSVGEVSVFDNSSSNIEAEKLCSIYNNSGSCNGNK